MYYCEQPQNLLETVLVVLLRKGFIALADELVRNLHTA